MRGGRVAAAIALAACSACAALSACAARGPVDRAQSLVRQHREVEAVALLRERLRAAPDDLAARKLLVRVLAVSGDLSSARVEVQALAARVPPDDPGPLLELGHALELSHQYDEALAAYDEAASVAPQSPQGPREAGMRSAHWGEAAAALPRLEEAIRRGARDAETWHALGVVRLSLGDLEGAEVAYRAGAAAGASGAENWLGLATIAVARGDAKGALDAYGEVLARRPRFAGAELGRAWALTRLGRLTDASRALDRAAELGAPAAPIARQRALLAAQAEAGAPRP